MYIKLFVLKCFSNDFIEMFNYVKLYEIYFEKLSVKSNFVFHNY